MQKVRVDKWLWSVRIFKSRSIASEACKNGKVSINNKKVKPSYQLSVSEILRVKKDGFNLTFEVVKLISKRVSATLAAPCYKNLTPSDEFLKYKDWFVGKASSENRIKGAGRPTKKERRTISDFKDSYLLED